MSSHNSLVPMHHFHTGLASRLTALVLATGLLAGCAASESEGAARFLVAPGKYVLFTCPQIAEQAQKNSHRQHELEVLMAKAGNGSAGRLVSTVAYRPEYLQLRGEMADLRQAAANKNCNFVPSATDKAQPTSGAAIR